ncbi:MAG: DUF5675 family protein [Chitinispirillia bacterium]|nr:DUF5675 family protein [Chitinispirillia bacterium]
MKLLDAEIRIDHHSVRHLESLIDRANEAALRFEQAAGLFSNGPASITEAPAPISAPKWPQLKQVRLTRSKSTESGTFGMLAIDGVPFCVTCECPWKSNERNVSCIPVGRYRCEIITRASNGQKAYELKNVPNRTGILIHPGNTIKDIEGCILLGAQYGDFGGMPGVTSSTVTTNLFMANLGEQPFELEIISA